MQAIKPAPLLILIVLIFSFFFITSCQTTDSATEVDPEQPPQPAIQAIITADSTASEDSPYTLSAADSTIIDGTSILWEQINIPTGRAKPKFSNPSALNTTVQFYVEDPSETLTFRLTLRSANITSTATHSVVVEQGNIDLDGDGLIGIRGLTMLHNIRYNLRGTSYKTSADDQGITSGCPNSGADCKGYELLGDLNFDVDDDGETWTENEGQYTLDRGDSNDAYFPVEGGGWLPISSETLPFNAIFDGNGYIINGLAIQRNQENIGLFGHSGSEASIRNIGLINNLSKYSGTGVSNNVGGLVGLQEGGLIVASFVDGRVEAGDGDYDSVGAMVGRSDGGQIVASYTLGQVNGGDGNFDRVGGLVGWQTQGEIIACYTSGTMDAGAGGSEFVGGLVGRQTAGRIVASYSTAYVDGGDGNNDNVGYLVGVLSGGNVVASFGFGTISGAETSRGKAGTQITNRTWQSLSLEQQNVSNLNLEITQDPNNESGNPDDDKWNNAVYSTMGSWNFTRRTSSGGPTLNYADFDGDSGNIYHCADQANPPPDAIVIPNCGRAIPGQLSQ